MRLIPLASLFLCSLIPVLVGCGSSGDDDDDDSSSRDSDAASEPTSKGDGRSDAKVPKVKAGTYGSGTVHIEITGEKSQKIDLDGNGIAQDGFAIFTYGNNADAGAQISISNEDEPGGVFLTTKEIATAGEWGKDCKVTLEQTGGEAKGDFSCDTIDAVQPGSVKTYRIKLKGTFTAGP